MVASYQRIVGSLRGGGPIQGRIRLRLVVNRETGEYVDVDVAADGDEMEALIAFVLYAIRYGVKALSALPADFKHFGPNITFFAPPPRAVEELRGRDYYRFRLSLMTLSRQLEECGLLMRGENGVLAAAELPRVVPHAATIELDLFDFHFGDFLTRSISMGLNSLRRRFRTEIAKVQTEEIGDAAVIAPTPRPAIALDEEETPDALQCPITLMPIIDPVSCTLNGHAYERTALERHFHTNGRFDPCTRAVVGTLHERPDITQRIRGIRPS